MNRLESLGWNSFFEQQLDPDTDAGAAPARVFEEQRGSWNLWWEGGACRATIAGRLRLAVEDGSASRPCVGEWVTASFPKENSPDGAVIHRVLSRKSRFSRQAPGEVTEEQIVAANVDTVFLVQSLNQNFNVRRLERYMAKRELWSEGYEKEVKERSTAAIDEAVLAMEAIPPPDVAEMFEHTGAALSPRQAGQLKEL